MQRTTHTYMYPKVTPIAAAQAAATPKPASTPGPAAPSPRPAA